MQTQKQQPVVSIGSQLTARHQVVIVGGGSAGITVAARLSRTSEHLDIAILEPSAKHYYQPLWTLVGGGVFSKEVTGRDEGTLIPRGATWIQDAVTEFSPAENTILTRDGRKVEYEYL